MNSTTVCTPQTLRDAVSQVFTTMIFMAIDPTAPIDEEVQEEAGVIASVSFMGKFEGSIYLRCSLKCAKAITINLLGLDEEDEIEESDMADAMGEVANMTFGSMKSLAYEQVGELIASTPSVYTGKRMEQHLRAGETRLSTTVGVDDAYCLEIHMIYMDEK